MVAKKQALGRGLGALMEDAVRPEMHISGDAINEINIDDIELNPFQPRKGIEEEGLIELASSIKELGIIQPITVREIDEEKYQLITGERRYRASKIAGLTKIPAYVRTANDQNMLEMALVENIQREDLNAIEIAISYQRLIEECRLTQENLSERVGKKRSTITNYLRLLKLPAEIQLGIREKKITMGHAKSLINIENNQAQLAIFNRIIVENLSVRDAENIVRNLNEQPKKASNVARRIASLPEEYTQLQNHLSTYFNSNIEFKRNPKGEGKIIIPFKSDEDLERILGIFDNFKA
ncbi:MAG: ParB/RepB/Spo0J family partition protein [Bacteroidales bacterium]|nr:ParB/RepB/Spo0J family partition protein [Bacteroidales bacterium]